MTDTATADRTETRETLWVTDAELIRRMGVPQKKARHILRYFDNNPKMRFPQKDRLFGDRRYWPAVRAFLDQRNRLNMEASPKQRGSNV